jgi:hypothetical protein
MDLWETSRWASLRDTQGDSAPSTSLPGLFGRLDEWVAPVWSGVSLVERVRRRIAARAAVVGLTEGMPSVPGILLNVARRPVPAGVQEVR